MPYMRKLNTTEVAALEQPVVSPRAQIAQMYDAHLAGFAAGDYGQVELAAGERRAVVRARLHAAASRRALFLRFRSGPHAVLIFHVTAAPPRTRPAPSLPAPIPEPPQPHPRAAAEQRPPRRGQSATERYRTMLPRWMRMKQPGGQGERSKRRTR